MVKGTTSYKDTALGILPRSKLLPLELEGVKKGLEYIHDLVARKSAISVQPKLICQLHKIAFGWIFPDWAGKYRQIQVTYSGKEAPAYFKVPELVTDLCRDLKVRLKHLPHPQDKEYMAKVVELLAWFQHRFVIIHPFNDYNGRIARMLTILILLSLNLPPIELKANTKQDRQKYLTALQRADEGDLSRLELLIDQALRESLKRLASRH